MSRTSFSMIGAIADGRVLRLHGAHSRSGASRIVHAVLGKRAAEALPRPAIYEGRQINDGGHRSEFASTPRAPTQAAGVSHGASRVYCSCSATLRSSPPPCFTLYVSVDVRALNSSIASCRPLRDTCALEGAEIVQARYACHRAQQQLVSRKARFWEPLKQQDVIVMVGVPPGIEIELREIGSCSWHSVFLMCRQHSRSQTEPNLAR